MNYNNITYPLDKIYSNATGVTYPVCGAQGGSAPDPKKECFYLQNASEDTAEFKFTKMGDITADTEYSIDGGHTWIAYDFTTQPTVEVEAGSKIYFRGNSFDNSESYYYIGFNMNKSYNVGGNLMSISDYDNMDSVTTISTKQFKSLFINETNLVSAVNMNFGNVDTVGSYCFQNMFRGCSSLTTAPTTLPATTLADHCYSYMFYECTSLTTSPTLPATTLADHCYEFMFASCSSLTTAPVLPATTLESSCYSSMFRNCTSLTTTPELPAKTLETWCYGNMFNGCSHLNKVIIYADNISASNCLESWLSNVSATGDFYNLGSATYSSGASGIPSGWTEHNSL